MKNYITPLSNGSFPLVPTGTLVNLALGNGTLLRVCVTPIPGEGTLFSIVSCGRMGGAYVLNFAPSYGYLVEKFRLLEGDAICFARFVAAQLA